MCWYAATSWRDDSTPRQACAVWIIYSAYMPPEQLRDALSPTSCSGLVNLSLLLAFNSLQCCCLVLIASYLRYVAGALPNSHTGRWPPNHARQRRPYTPCPRLETRDSQSSTTSISPSLDASSLASSRQDYQLYRTWPPKGLWFSNCFLAEGVILRRFPQYLRSCQLSGRPLYSLV